MRRVGGLLCVGLLAACEARPEPEPLGELCGVRGPTLVLDVEPTQVLTEPPLRLGERALYTTRAPQARDEPQVAVKYGPPALAEVGACGASPRQLGALERPELRERWPGVALACDRERGQI